MQPIIKDGVSVLYRKTDEGYEVNFLIESSSVIVPFSIDESALSCIKLLDGVHSIESIATIVGISVEAVLSLTEILQSNGLLQTFSTVGNDYVSSRFETQVNFLAGFQTHSADDFQKRISDSRVTIIGLGGIGSWVAYGLVLAGVRKLTLVDADVVELSNLNRQCLYDTQSVGQPKVEVMSAKLRVFEPELVTTNIQCLVDTSETCAQVSTDSDLVICCADEPGTDEVNRLVSETCFLQNLPHILCGGYDGHLGFIGPTIVPGAAGCWFCYEQTLEHQLLSAGYHHLQITPTQIKGGNLGSISAIIANYHVTEALKVLSGFAKPTLLNQVAEMDFLTYTIHMRQYHKRSECCICSS
jgi:hypothetical protein